MTSELNVALIDAKSPEYNQATVARSGRQRSKLEPLDQKTLTRTPACAPNIRERLDNEDGPRFDDEKDTLLKPSLAPRRALKTELLFEHT